MTPPFRAIRHIIGYCDATLRDTDWERVHGEDPRFDILFALQLTRGWLRLEDEPADCDWKQIGEAAANVVDKLGGKS